ncbi:hypothetical protein [Paenibacillus terrae]|uniref:Uncharacterized protein n=1 Tax=Paenibacillus terrae TaxID=159743 RepID=A0A0D7WYD8_9BACL|nr:hypothetical protein [Paenibacillus terrae]KJD43989.1 hypothetical protein QD47_19470 [Paenibacillus terrae]
MKKISPATITKAQAAALEAVRSNPNYFNDAEILNVHSKNSNGWNTEYQALNGMEYRQLKKTLKYGYTTHVKVKRIVVTRGEGPSSECRIPHNATSWEDADKILKRMALTAPNLGYDKTDFVILFTNGDVYSGTYGLKREDRFSASLYGHVTDHCEFYGGICKRLPNHIKEDQYQSLVGENAVEYLLLLDNVIYPSANQEGLDPELIQSVLAKPNTRETKRYLGTLETNFTLQKVKNDFNNTMFYVYSNGSRHNSFKSHEALNRWMEKFGLTLGEEIRDYTYRINGAYRVTMIQDREGYLHLPQIAILMNGGMVRAYKDVTPDVTNIYVVTNYKEEFQFDYNKPSGQWYLRKFFWDK